MLFIIAVVLGAILLVVAVRSIPNIPSPLDWLLPVIILLVAAYLVVASVGIG